eukprot:6192296-Pleurochrysis_carterae.AAC.6
MATTILFYRMFSIPAHECYCKRTILTEVADAVKCKLRSCPSCTAGVKAYCRQRMLRVQQSPRPGTLKLASAVALTPNARF